MNTPQGSSRGATLDRLQQDSPESPQVGHLRNRLSLSGDSPSPWMSNKGGGSSIITPSPDYLRDGSATLMSSQQSAGTTEATMSEVGLPVEVEGTRVTTHSHSPISADFLSSSTGALQRKDTADNFVDSGGERKREGNSTSKLESYVLVHNVAKRHNLGTIARSATAFGVSELILVGRKDFNAFGSHGASLHVQFRHFHTLPEAALYLKAKDVDICGVEIVEGATPVHKHPFIRSTAFVLGNEGTGLSKKEMDICSFFVYIPQCGSGTASLNVTVAASIVLHHFSVWAGFTERKREGHKFVVAEKPMRRTPRNIAENPDEVRERRCRQANSAGDSWLSRGEDKSEIEESNHGIGQIFL